MPCPASNHFVLKYLSGSHLERFPNSVTVEFSSDVFLLQSLDDTARTIRLDLITYNWSEIDAIKLVGRTGKSSGFHWRESMCQSYIIPSAVI